MAWLPRQPKFWLAAFLLWFVVLWVLSSLTLSTTYQPPVNNFDKFEHFGYFFGGGGLFSAWLFRRNPGNPDWTKIILTTVGVIALVGVIDEFHQTFTPGRSGNDPFDWLADVSGAAAGALVFRLVHRCLK
ncbi:VanZ family protein [Luteolibacter yonseiensis]|uniref:VanZ family protein n=1 Tax=Luteolibacter yonseiensis TaxID=1144680 RepID=A0A934V7A5_9BACT|nr:VanZ family protein [Luteolibacter yonseiensis]MBK1815932.1 VanZ family protein [Luteolibacter yonseiensis]